MIFSFSVPSATIIFIDIDKFSEYSCVLSPSQIMESLSSIYGQFDSITEIKIIGDIYIAAGDILNPDEPLSHHACQLVQFGLECTQAIDELFSESF
jgi:hypothetical protein